MVIRRYRSIDGQRDLHTFFEEGLFSKRLTEFKDENEGVLENFEREGGLAGALAAEAGMKRRRSDQEIKKATDDEWLEGLGEYHNNARKQHFANCWRLGTDEKDRIWKTYTRDEDMVQGCAIETTVGKFLASLPVHPLNSEYDESDPGELFESPEWNLALQNPNCDIKVGTCRYQKRWKDESYQPGGWPAAVAFFKGEDFEIENEFRLVFNPYSANRILDCDLKGIPITPAPDTTEKWKKFVAATKYLANKIIMAPNSGDTEREKVLDWLAEFGLDVNTSSSSDIELVESSACTSQCSTHTYLAELGGNANYDQSDQHLSDVSDEFIAKRDWDDWPIIDIVFLHTDQAGGIIEGYWHQNDESAFELSEYGHPFQRVWVARFQNQGKKRETWRNDNAKEFDNEQGQRALSFADVDEC
ncbi:hypothetical protein [Haloferax massiliensis]|uniref:Uncharacterized protein n=1 Tax=Haloferax massiliensis TaxID=1476858 RepID=A0A0D6JN46_9EURY|nr:hypothetical protein [Haloferax massiliensis]CQR49040.1 hypothetical protein BN996_00495 [Haloferax massiliensis]